MSSVKSLPSARKALKGLIIATLLFPCSPGLAQQQTDQTVLKITPVAPAIIYPIELSKDHRFSALTLLCTDFERKSTKDIGLFLHQTRVPNIIWSEPPPPPGQPEAHQVYAVLNPANDQLDLWLPWPDYSGKIQVQLAVTSNGTNKFSKPYEIIISGVDSRWAPVLYAAAVSLAILLLPVVLIKIGRVTYHVDQRQYGVLRALFLDKETDTYSLSKFQFYAWTAAGVFGYILLTIAQSLVQGKFVFADIPKNLPGIILISAATTATSQGITAAKGAKGAGAIYPSMADFITTGGLVVAERFQFFVWTIVGVFTFLFLVVFSDPGNITDLPQIPDGFLALMGISSFGYLGGKLARKPGPIIDEVAASIGSLIVEIRGRKLSRSASFRIDNAEVRLLDTIVTGIEADDNSQPSDMFKTLTLKIAEPEPNHQLVGVRHNFGLINPDGQEAEWFYVIPSKPVISLVVAQVVDQKLVLKITGLELSQDAALQIGQDAVKQVNATFLAGVPDERANGLFKTLTVTIRTPQPEWQRADAAVTLINPDGQQAVAASLTVLPATPIVQSPPFQSPP
jgi:hypothetical protein